MNVGKRYLFFDNTNGEVLINEMRSRLDIMPTVERVIEIYPKLYERDPSTYDVLVLDYDDYSQDFVEGRLIGVNVETKVPIFEYPNPENPDEPIIPPKPLSEQILELKEEQDKTKRMLSDSYSEQQLLIELLIDMGVL